jgi:hypothetical protein
VSGAQPLTRTFPSDEDMSAALAALPLKRIEDPRSPAALNAAHIRLAASLVRVARTLQSEAVLCWPAQPDGVAVLHALASLALASLAPTQDPSGLRVLYFPWTSRAGESAKRALIDRNWLEGVHIGAINRAYQHNTDKSDWFKFHLLMARVRDLGRVTPPKGRGPEFEAFTHPLIGETCASGPLGEPEHARLALYRVRKHTVIRKMAFGAADGVEKCPFALLGIGQDSVSPELVRRAQVPIHAVLVNAIQRRCDYLGPGWQRRIAEMLAAVRKVHRVSTPVLAVTDDPWIQHVLATEILPEHHGEKERGAVRRSTVLMEPCKLTEARGPFRADGGDDIRLVAPSGAPASIEDTYRQLLDDAFGLGERGVHALVIESREAFRRFVNLPGSLAEWKKYLHEHSGLFPEQQADAIGAMDATTPLARLTAEYTECLSVQANRELIAKLVVHVQEYVSHHSTMRSATAEAFAKIVEEARKSDGRTAVVVADERTREFVEHRLGSESGDEKILICSLSQFRDVADGRLPSPENLTRGVIFGPGRRRLLQLMGLRQLPATVVVVAPLGVVRAVAADAAQLATREALKPLAGRLERLSIAAMDCCDRCTSQLPNLDWKEPPPPEFDATRVGGLVDLRGTVGAVQATDLVIRTDNDALILARPQSTVVRYDPDAPVDAFYGDHAESLRPGDRICVLGREFLDEVKERFGSGTAVAKGVRAYHQLVADKVASLPGACFSEKATRIASQMAAAGRDVSVSRVLDWIRADRWLQQDDMTVRPHAPWHFEDFRAFLEVLGVPHAAAGALWQFGVAMTRRDRLIAASQFSDVWVSILTHTLDMADQYRDRAGDIWAIRARAESSVAVVVDVQVRGKEATWAPAGGVAR